MSGSGSLSYYLLAATYLPPGNLSTATYLNGTSIGSQVQIQETSASGVVAQISGPTVQASASWQYGNISGEAFQVTSNGSWGPQVTSNKDLSDHLNDKFWIWTNPEMNVTSQDSNVTVSLHPPAGELINVIDVSVGELAGLVPLPAFKAAQLANLTDDDKAAILQTNPYVATTTGDINPGPSLDGNRFTFLQEHFQVTGPDHPGDPPAGIAIDTNTQNIHGIIEGYQHQVTGSLLVGVKVAFITEASALFGFQWQYTYQKTEQSNTGTITDAQGLLESSTTCWHQGIDVFWDGMFGTYAFQPTDNGSGDCNEVPKLAGLMLINGAPAHDVQVSALLSNGTTWLASTNAQGLFKFYGLPDGSNPIITSSPAATFEQCAVPSISCPPDVQAECTGNGSAFADPGHATASAVCTPATIDEPGPGDFPLGMTTVTHTARDAVGLSAFCTNHMFVVDTTPPVITLSASPSSLWPPNHKLASIHITASTSDACTGASLPVTLISATATEPGTGTTVPASSIQGATLGTADLDFQVVSERSGQAAQGRVYTFTYQATDPAGNVATKDVTVTVPHDQR